MQRFHICNAINNCVSHFTRNRKDIYRQSRTHRELRRRDLSAVKTENSPTSKEEKVSIAVSVGKL